MIKMDFKGIMWVGNVFQKFEAMCLEVEEVVCEDTVKYVENQVQTVGASMKKFYSEVMQDVLPPSSIDPVKVAAADLSLNPYADFSYHKKPKTCTKKDNVADLKRESGDLKVKSEKKENCSSVLRRNGGTGSDGKSRRGIIRTSPKEMNLTPEVSRLFNPPQDLARVPKCGEIDENYDVATNQSDTVMSKNKRSGSVRVEGFEKVTTSSVAAADMIPPSESGGKIEKLVRDTSGQDQPDESSAGINVAFGTVGVHSMIGSYVSCNPRNNESTSEDFSPRGNANVNMFESDEDFAEPAEAIQEFDRLNCIVVGREDLSIAALKEDKPKSYKKKIRKAFSSKKSARKQEYKQLAVQHCSLGTGLNQEIADSSMPELLDKEKLPPHRISESEWELL